MNQATAPHPLRHDWSRSEIEALFALPFADLMFRAQTVHRRFFDPNEVQVSTLLSIKTGTCPEDCKYCPQSVRYDTGRPGARPRTGISASLPPWCAASRNSAWRPA
jgi:biotin synthase